MSGTERGEDERDENGNHLYRHTGACLSIKCPCYAAGAAAALAEHESEVEGWKAVARAKSAMIEMAQAEAAALRTERIMSDHTPCPNCGLPEYLHPAYDREREVVGQKRCDVAETRLRALEHQ